MTNMRGGRSANETTRRPARGTAVGDERTDLDAPTLRSAESDVLRFQRLAGNRAVAAMLDRPQITWPRLGTVAELGVDAGVGTRTGAAADVEMPERDHAEGFVAPSAELQDVMGPPQVGGEEGSGTAAHATPSTVSAPSGIGISAPQPVSWAALNPAGDDGARAIPGPSVASLPAIQAAAGGSTGVVGWTSFPLATAKAPQFDFGTVASSPGGTGPPSFASTPTWKQHFYEGDSVCMFLGAARHATVLTEGGKAVFWNVSAAISARDSSAEGEHSNDIKLARDISIKEAETVLTDQVIGKTFPASGTQAQAEQRVLDKITSKITHAGLGNDQSLWAAKYETLYRKTLGRDNKAWHTFSLGNRKEIPPSQVDYDLTNGSTSVNVTPSANLIVY